MNPSSKHHRPHYGPLRLSHRRRGSVYAIGLGLWLSGLAWLAFHYFLQRQGPFGPEPRPAEIWWLRVHAAFGFFALWGFGMVWSAHIVAGWHTGRQRWSGGLPLAVLGLLIVTGYLMYYVTDDGLHASLALTHWIVGITLPVLMTVHIVLGRRRTRQTPTA